VKTIEVFRARIEQLPLDCPLHPVTGRFLRRKRNNASNCVVDDLTHQKPEKFSVTRTWSPGLWPGLSSQVGWPLDAPVSA
jgi:hypothetical protein